MKKGDKIVCIDAGEVRSLELYKTYIIHDCLSTRYLIIINIKGWDNYRWYKQSRFISESEFRKRKLEKLNIEK